MCSMVNMPLQPCEKAIVYAHSKNEKVASSFSTKVHNAIKEFSLSVRLVLLMAAITVIILKAKPSLKFYIFRRFCDSMLPTRDLLCREGVIEGRVCQRPCGHDFVFSLSTYHNHQ